MIKDSQHDPMTVIDVAASHLYILGMSADRDDEALAVWQAALEMTAHTSPDQQRSVHSASPQKFNRNLIGA